jgi:Flp pilus assembly CpaE family ATPase
MAGYKKIRTDAGALMVSSLKLKFGQTTRTGISIAFVPVDGGVEATVTATATAQSLLSMASSPAERAVNKVVGLLEAGS